MECIQIAKWPWLVAWLLIPLCWAGDDNALFPGRRSVIKDFKMSASNYAISGKRAVIRGRRIRIEDMTARLIQDGKEIHIETPRCDFDQLNKTGKSSEEVRIRGENMTIDGIGFDLDLTRQRVWVRRSVKMVIRNVDNNLLGK